MLTLKKYLFFILNDLGADNHNKQGHIACQALTLT